MLARVDSCALAGLAGEIVQVEIDIHQGLPHTTVVGLPGAAVRESKDRLYAALRNVGFRYPLARVTVNLAPADLRKAGPHYDLPIALGILSASGQLLASLDDAIAIGEIALDGSLRHTDGILPVAVAARGHGYRRMIVPAANAAEAALVPGLCVLGAPDLAALVAHLDEGAPLPPAPRASVEDGADPGAPDLSEVRGQAHARRALEIAAAGGHNLLMSGPPGAGKTMLARCMPTILPPLSLEEALEVTAIRSVARSLPAGAALVRARAFRSPHHTISTAGLIGGGSWPRPGEVSLAHHGVLFLDELPEFEPRVLEVLRQPLEDRRVTIARAAGRATFPASFTLVAARNPCPCGYHGDPSHPCSCGVAAILRYERRVSGPLLDRIDLHLEVPRVEHEQLLDGRPQEPSARVRARVVAARERQRARLTPPGPRPGPPSAEPARRSSDAREGPAPSAEDRAPSPEGADERLLGRLRLDGRPSVPLCNAEMGPREVRRHCVLDAEGDALLQAAMRRLDLSARSYHRVLKLARTIADLDAAETIRAPHVAEALQYRARGPR